MFPERFTPQILGGVLLIVTVLPLGLRAQEESIDLNGVSLKIGMNQSEALERLAESNTLEKFSGGTGREWCIKAKSAPPDQTDCALVVFVDGKLSHVSRSVAWAHGDRTADLMIRLYTIIDEAERDGLTVSISTGREIQINKEQRMRSLEIKAGGKLYTLDIFKRTTSKADESNSYAVLSESKKH